MGRVVKALTVWNVGAPVLFLGVLSVVTLSPAVAEWLGDSLLGKLWFNVGLAWMFGGFIPIGAAIALAWYLQRRPLLLLNVAALLVWLIGTVLVLNTVH